MIENYKEAFHVYLAVRSAPLEFGMSNLRFSLISWHPNDIRSIANVRMQIELYVVHVEQYDYKNLFKQLPQTGCIYIQKISAGDLLLVSIAKAIAEPSQRQFCDGP